MHPTKQDDDWPPVLVIIAGVGAFTGAIPGLLYGVFVVLTGGLALYAVVNPVIALVCVALPWLLVVGAVRLMTQRSRWLLICTGLPVTAFLVWMLLTDGPPWQFAWLLGPAVAPLVAMAPSVGRWLESKPFRVT